jgi:hypothetical protein
MASKKVFAWELFDPSHKTYQPTPEQLEQMYETTSADPHTGYRPTAGHGAGPSAQSHQSHDLNKGRLGVQHMYKKQNI